MFACKISKKEIFLWKRWSARPISEIREVECELFKLSPVKGELTIVGEGHTLYLTYSPRKGVGVVKAPLWLNGSIATNSASDQVL